MCLQPSIRVSERRAIEMPGAATRQSSNTYCGNPYCGYSTATTYLSTGVMTMTSNPLAIPASAPWAVAPATVAEDRDVRSRRAAADHDRRGATEADRLARTLRERRLFARYRTRGEQAARDELVQRFLPLATGLARRYHRGA